MRRSDLPKELDSFVNIAGDDDEFILNGGSAVLGPEGAYVAGPAFGSEVIILARINLDRIREESLTLDVTGHFNRPDLFEFQFKGGGAKRNEAGKPDPRAAFDKPNPRDQQQTVVPARGEYLASSGTDATPAFRVITSPTRPAGYDSEIHELDKNRKG